MVLFIDNIKTCATEPGLLQGNEFFDWLMGLLDHGVFHRTEEIEGKIICLIMPGWGQVRGLGLLLTWVCDFNVGLSNYGEFVTAVIHLDGLRDVQI